MNNLPVSPEWLADKLRATARGYYPAEAATDLLVRHDTWLRRRDFLANCVHVEHENDEWADDGVSRVLGPGGPDYQAASRLPLDDQEATWVWIEWENVTGFLEGAACSSSEARMLRLAAELAGHDTGIPLGELLSGLDARNSALVVAAVAHVRIEVLQPGRAAGWPARIDWTTPEQPDNGPDPGPRTGPGTDPGGRSEAHACRVHLDRIGYGAYPYECVFCGRRYSTEDVAGHLPGDPPGADHGVDEGPGR